ncbi:MAG: PilZ domain-containing protein [Acidithiobacillus sp.]|uniref:PilZ domain-containing protein n=1 Tax=Acidithiobacillus sp. TaxID=1872118 RepID=UPI003D04C163
MDDRPESMAARALSVVLRDLDAVQRYFMPRIKGGAVLVETPHHFKIGADVLLMITLPDGQPRAPVMGKVVWVTPPDNREGHPPGIGVQFTNDRSGVLIRIQNLLLNAPAAPREVLTF